MCSGNARHRRAAAPRAAARLRLRCERLLTLCNSEAIYFTLTKSEFSVEDFVLFRGVVAALTIATPLTIRVYTEHYEGGSVAEWLARWIQAQKGPGSNRSRDAVG